MALILELEIRIGCCGVSALVGAVVTRRHHALALVKARNLSYFRRIHATGRHWCARRLIIAASSARV